MNNLHYISHANYSLLNQFVGRRSELGRFRKSLDVNNVVSISGIKGVGKSSFILKSLDQIKFLWIEYQSQIDEPTLIKSIAALLPAIYEFSLESLIDSLETKSITLVLDNFEYLNDELKSKCLKQFHSVFKNSKLIVCSRGILPSEVYNGFTFILEGLNSADSKHLIKSTISSYSENKIDKYEVASLVDELCGHPLLIQSYLKNRFMQSIVKSSISLHSYDQVISFLITQLDYETLRFVQLCSLLNCAIEVKDLEKLDIRNSQLQRLIDIHIIKLCSERNSFQVTMVVQTGCLVYLEDQELIELHKRAFHFACAVSYISYESIFNLATCASLHRELIDYSLCIIDNKAMIGEDYFIVEEHFIDCLLGVNYKQDQLLFYKCECNITSINIKVAKQTIEKISDTKIKAMGVARLNSVQGFKDKAKAELLRCLDFDVDKQYKVIIYFDLCYVLIHLKDFQLSEMKLKELQLLLLDTSLEAKNHCLTILATIKYNQNEYQEALELCFQIEKFHSQHQNTYPLGETQFYIICNYMGLGLFDKAFEYSEKHKLILRELQDDLSWYFYHSRLSLIYEKQSKHGLSKKQCYKAYHLAKKADWTALLAIESRRLASLEITDHNIENALEFALESRSLTSSSKNTSENILSHCVLVAIYIITDDTRLDIELANLKILNLENSECQRLNLVFDLLLFYRHDGSTLQDLANEHLVKYESDYLGLSLVDQKYISDNFGWLDRLLTDKINHRVIVNRSVNTVSNIIELDSYLLRKQSFQLFGYQDNIYIHGSLIDFEKYPIQKQILLCFINQPSKVWTQGELIAKVWNNDFPLDKDRTHLRVQIHKLKNTLNLQFFIRPKRGAFLFNQDITHCFIL